jgi:DNA-binding LytR/AlgR family response regulator
MIPVKCIILEDTPADMELLIHFVKSEPSLQLLSSFENPLEANPFIRNQHPPLLFLDIDMPVINGMDFLKALDYDPVCVFVTAYSDYAVKSYDAHAFDFILKPVTDKRFNATVKRVTEYLEVKTKAELYDATFEDKSIMLKEGTTTHRVDLLDIVYLEALKDYTKVVTIKRKYIVLSKLKHFMDKLLPGEFVRIHRSFALARNKIAKITRDEVVLTNGTLLPIGKTYKGALS